MARIASLLVTLALAACVTTPVPDPAPIAPDPDPAPLSVLPPSGESAAFARFYRSAEARLVSRGLLRTDGGGSDTPFTADQLAANFERIALYDEYTLQNGRFVQRQTPSTLRRWTAPVRLQAHFGASVEAGQQGQDRAMLASYAARLGRITGHPISATSSGGNYHVLFMTTDELAASAPLLRSLVPGISAPTISQIENLGRNTYCSVFAFSQPGSSVYTAAIAVIRAEHPSLLRRGCVHEEIAQGLGLPNDSPAARPSIFNDDEEFALLTRHDEALLRILYDPRLSIGMTPEAARPTVRMIAGELVGGPS
jgi:hypothetical protein